MNFCIQLKCLKPSFSLLEEPDRTKFDTMGSVVFSIFGCFAEQEIIEKKERFHRGREQKAIEGKFAGGRVPYGYRVDEERGNLIVIDEDEASVIRTIFDLYEAGLSQPRIAVELQERGIKYQYPRSVIAALTPLSAASRNQCTARSQFCSTPSPYS